MTANRLGSDGEMLERSSGKDNGAGGRQGPQDEGGTSGRLFVIVGCLAILALWGGIYLAFSGWKARYLALAEFGRTEVAPLVDPLALMEPEGVDSRLWKQAIEDTHTMLIGLTSAGVLDQEAMTALREDIKIRVKQATPTTALATLAKLWDDLEERAGPVISSDVTPVDPNSRHAHRVARPARPVVLPAKETQKDSQAQAY